MHLLAIYRCSTAHYRGKLAADSGKCRVPAKQGIFDFLLILLYLCIRHGILFIIGKRFILGCRSRIVELIHLIHDGIVLLEEALDHIIDSIGIILCGNGDCFPCLGLAECSKGQSVNFKHIGIVGKCRTV